MAGPIDMIMPTLREMRAENGAMHERTQLPTAELEGQRGGVERVQVSYRQALSADTLMSRLLTGEFGERIEQLERRVRAMDGRL